MPACFNHRRAMLGAVVISYDSGYGDTFGDANVVVSKPAGVVNNDLLVGFMGYRNTAVTWTGATGWTERVDQGAAPNIRVATKVASSEGSSYTFTASSSSSSGAGAIVALRGASYNAIGSVCTRTGNGTLAVTGLACAAGLNLIGVYVDDSAATISTPSGYTLIADIDLLVQRIALFAKRVGAETTGTANITIGNAVGSNSGGIQINVANA